MIPPCKSTSIPQCEQIDLESSCWTLSQWEWRMAHTHLFSTLNGDVYVLENQVQVLSIPQAVVPELYTARMGPGAGWSCLLDLPGSLDHKKRDKRNWQVQAAKNSRLCAVWGSELFTH